MLNAMHSSSIKFASKRYKISSVRGAVSFPDVGKAGASMHKATRFPDDVARKQSSSGPSFQKISELRHFHKKDTIFSRYYYTFNIHFNTCVTKIGNDPLSDHIWSCITSHHKTIMQATAVKVSHAMTHFRAITECL